MSELGSFSLDLDKFGEKALANAGKIVRKTAFDLHAKIVKRMPVETGRAKANTQISVGSVPNDTIEGFKDKTPRGSMSAQTLQTAEIGAASFELGTPVFIYNNVEYIRALEWGHSQLQAPQGMFRISFQETIQELNSIAPGTVK